MPNDKPNDWSTRDKYNSWLVRIASPTVAGVFSLFGALLLWVGAGFVADLKATKLESSATTKDVAVLKEALNNMKGTIEAVDKKVEKIEKGQERTNDKLDRLIEMNRRPR